MGNMNNTNTNTEKDQQSIYDIYDIEDQFETKMWGRQFEHVYEPVFLAPFPPEEMLD